MLRCHLPLLRSRPQALRCRLPPLSHRPPGRRLSQLSSRVYLLCVQYRRPPPLCRPPLLFSPLPPRRGLTPLSSLPELSGICERIQRCSLPPLRCWLALLRGRLPYPGNC